MSFQITFSPHYNRLRWPAVAVRKVARSCCHLADKVIQTNVDDLIKELANGEYFYAHKSDPATLANYRAIRANDPQDPVKRAARIIYLLKTCFNGLMRVNKAGKFNVAPGSYRDPVICDEPALRAAAAVFRQTIIAGPCDSAFFPHISV